MSVVRARDLGLGNYSILSSHVLVPPAMEAILGAPDNLVQGFLAAGHVYVYNPEGRLIDTIEVPERPVQVVFGGADRRTLFIAARTSLYSVRTRVPGR